MKRFIFISTALLFTLQSPHAYSANKAKYAGEFIAIGVGGRALGLGGAYSALVNDVTAGYWNPAGLSLLQYPQLALMHDERFGGLENYDYGAFALPVGSSSTIGLSVIRLGVDEIANTSQAWTDLNHDGIPESNEIDYSKITYYNAADWAFYLSYAHSVSPTFSYGANIKFIRRSLSAISATGVGFDLAVRYSPAKNLALGLNVQDATTTLIVWNNGTNELVTPTFKFGSAYLIDALGGQFAPVVDIDVRFEHRLFASNAHLGSMSLDFHEGLEYSYQHLAALRVGYSELGSLNVGAGIHLPKFDIDYSFSRYQDDQQIGNTHRISLMFTFEAPQFARQAE